MFLREVQATKVLVDPRKSQESIILPFLKEHQKRKIEQMRRNTQIKSISQLHENNGPGHSAARQSLEDVLIALNDLLSRLLVVNLEQLAPVLERLIATSKASGYLSFYFISVYLQTQIQFVYCRRKEGYIIWKKFLRTCNLQGRSLQKYKLLAYRQLAKCCLDLRDFPKAEVYLKKMLKLSWVVRNRTFELLAYDMIAINYYYQGDVERAQFFHQKFVSGDFERKESNVREAGVGEYLTKQRYKQDLNDQDSFSFDDMDLDAIIQKDNIIRWQKGLATVDTKQQVPHRVIINQWSCNRDLTIHLIQREKLKMKSEEEEVGFVPINKTIKKLVQFFHFDVKYYMKNGNLFNFEL